MSVHALNKLSGTHISSQAKMAGSPSVGAGGISGPSATRTPAMQAGASTQPELAGVPMPEQDLLGGVNKQPA